MGNEGNRLFIIYSPNQCLTLNFHTLTSRTCSHFEASCTSPLRWDTACQTLGKGELSKHGHGGHYCPEKPFIFWSLLHDQSPGSQLLSLSQIFQALNYLSKRRKRRWTRYGNARPELVQWDLEFSYQIMWHSHLSFARFPSQILIMLLMEERAPFSLEP